MSLIANLGCGGSMRKRIAAARTRLYRVALAWCGDGMLADDLVQDALALGLQRVHQLRDRERLYPWLYTILHNCWKQHLKTRRPHEDLDEQAPSEEPGPDKLTHRIEVINRVRREVMALPVEQRKVLALVDLEGFSYQEVSDILDVPIGTVMSRLHRARKTLCERFDAQDGMDRARRPQLTRVK